MLAAVEASAVVGVEDGELFPSTDKERASVYGAGRRQLEEHGWIVEVPDHDEEYDLNADLFQMVAVVGQAQHVLATALGEEEGDRRLALHYLVDESVTELWATESRNYTLRMIPDRAGLYSRLAEILDLDVATIQVAFNLEGASLKKVQALAGNGELDEAISMLSADGVDAASASALVRAFGVDRAARISVVQTVDGDIGRGRRVSIYGSGNSAWCVWRLDAVSDENRLSACDADTIGRLVEEWIDEHSN